MLVCESHGSQKLTHTPAKCWQNIGLRYLTMETSKKSTGDESNPLTSFAAAIHASLSAQQENDEAKKTQDTCGRGSEKRLASYDPDTQSWKMYGDTSLWGERQSLESLPASGMTRNGVLYQQPAWVPIIDVIESSLLPTPRASIYKNRKFWQRKSGYWGNLEEVRPGEEANIGKPINLQWLEWTMGFPIGWTDLEHSETL